MSDEELTEVVKQAITKGLEAALSEDTIEDLDEDITSLSETLSEALEGEVPDDVSIFEELGEALGIFIIGVAANQVINRLLGGGGNKVKKVASSKVGKKVGAKVGVWVGRAAIAALTKYVNKRGVRSDDQESDSTTEPPNETDFLPEPVQESTDSKRFDRLTGTINSITSLTSNSESADETG